jgi:oligosaccharide repeat unit polymerase
LADSAAEIANLMERPIFSLLLALGIMLTAMALLANLHWQHATTLGALVGLTCYPLIHGYLVDGKVDVFEPIFLFVTLYAFFYISRPLYLLMTGETSSLLGFYLDRETMALALLACALGLFAFHIGYYWGRSRSFKPGFMDVASLDLPRARFLAWACIAVGVLAYVYVIFVLGGGWEATFNTERTARYYISAKNPYVASLTSLVGAGLVGLCFLALLDNERKVKWHVLIGLVLAFGAVEITYSGSRRFLVNIIFAVLLQRHYLRKRLHVHRALPLLLVLMIFSASWLYVRSTMHHGSEAVRERLAQVNPNQVFDDVNTQGDNVIFDYLIAIMNTVPTTYDYGYGTGLLRFLYFPIPRQLWFDKPENVNRIMTQRYDPVAYLNGASAGTSMVGEWYMELGWLGILPGALLLGALLGLAYRWMLANLSTRLAVLIYSCGLFSFVAAITRGGMFGAATELAQLVLPMLLLLKLARRRHVPNQARWAFNWSAPPTHQPGQYFTRD